MLKDSQPPRYSVPRTRRSYSPQFKSELLTACKQPGASIAAVALQHGMNANVLHRWLKDHRQGPPLLNDGGPAPAFIPIDLGASRPVLNSEPSAPPSNIRIELQHHAMKVNWARLSSSSWSVFRAARSCLFWSGEAAAQLGA